MNQPEAHDAATKICLLVDRKLAILNFLLQQGLQQQQLVQEGDASQLLSLLAKKQSQIQALVDVQDAISELQEANPDSTLRWRSSQQQAECQQAIERCNSLGQQVLQLEATCEQMAQQARDAMAEQMQEFSNFRSSSSRSSSLQDHTHLAQFDESS